MWYGKYIYIYIYIVRRQRVKGLMKTAGFRDVGVTFVPPTAGQTLVRKET
jgi:hypothetical protein